MTAVQTLREPKAERLIDDPVPPSQMETDNQETLLDWFRRWCRQVDEHQKQDGTFDDPPSMEEIVAICKEVRAEMYEEQKIANSR